MLEMQFSFSKPWPEPVIREAARQSLAPADSDALNSRSPSAASWLGELGHIP